MKAGGGKIKGNAFERKVAAHIVSAFAEYGITKEDCYRTPSSGGHKYAKNSDPGDLVISEKLRKLGFRWHVEGKHHKSVRLWTLLYPQAQHKNAWKFKPWILQVCTAVPTWREKDNLVPVIVFKENGVAPILAAFPDIPDVTPAIQIPKNRISFIWDDTTWYVTLFADFLKVVKKTFPQKEKKNAIDKNNKKADVRRRAPRIRA